MSISGFLSLDSSRSAFINAENDFKVSQCFFFLLFASIMILQDSAWLTQSAKLLLLRDRMNHGLFSMITADYCEPFIFLIFQS
jgi:hypothetical protein